MNQIEIRLVSTKTNMLHVVNLMEQIVWDGGYKSLSEEGIEKFKKAQSLINELYTEFQWKCTDMCIAGMKESKALSHVNAEQRSLMLSKKNQGGHRE